LLAAHSNPLPKQQVSPLWQQPLLQAMPLLQTHWHVLGAERSSTSDSTIASALNRCTCDFGDNDNNGDLLPMN
jgi:hypothetical protein